MEETNDSIIIKAAETDEELCGRGYVHCTSWQEAYRGIVCDRYLDTMTVEATTARARQFPENTLIAKDKEKVVGFAVYGPSRDEDLMDAGEVIAIYVLSEYHDRKIGYRLMNEAISRLKVFPAHRCVLLPLFCFSFAFQNWFLNRFPRTELKTERHFCCS